MERMFYSVKETAEILEEPASTIRFWSDKFDKYVKVKRSVKGRRHFTPEGLEVLKQIKYLTHVEGLTLDGVAKELRDGSRSVAADIRVIEALKDIRAQLVEIKKLI